MAWGFAAFRGAKNTGEAGVKPALCRNCDACRAKPGHPPARRNRNPSRERVGSYGSPSVITRLRCEGGFFRSRPPASPCPRARDQTHERRNETHLAAAAAALLALPILAASAAIPETQSVGHAADYIRGHFQLDGAYGSGAAGQNFDAIIAVRAAGYDPAKDHTDTNVSPVTWLQANVAAQTTAPSAAKAALAAAALGQNPKAINGVDLIGRISGGLNPVTGLYAADDFSQSIAMLGLACTGNSVPLRPAQRSRRRS